MAGVFFLTVSHYHGKYHMESEIFHGRGVGTQHRSLPSTPKANDRMPFGGGIRFFVRQGSKKPAISGRFFGVDGRICAASLPKRARDPENSGRSRFASPFQRVSLISALYAAHDQTCYEEPLQEGVYAQDRDAGDDHLRAFEGSVRRQLHQFRVHLRCRAGGNGQDGVS